VSTERSLEPADTDVPAEDDRIHALHQRGHEIEPPGHEEDGEAQTGVPIHCWTHQMIPLTWTAADVTKHTSFWFVAVAMTIRPA